VTLLKCPGRHSTCTSSQKSVATSNMVVVAAGQQMITPRTGVGGPRGGKPDRLRTVGNALAPGRQGLPATAADATRKRRPSQASHLANLTKATRQILRIMFHHPSFSSSPRHKMKLRHPLHRSTSQLCPQMNFASLLASLRITELIWRRMLSPCNTIKRKRPSRIYLG